MASHRVSGFPPGLSCGCQILRDTFPLRRDWAQTSAQALPSPCSHWHTRLNRFEGDIKEQQRCRTLCPGSGLRVWEEAGSGREGGAVSSLPGLGAKVVLASLEGNNRVIKHRWFDG